MALLSIGRINFRSPFILQVPRRQTRPHLRSRRGRQREREPLGGGTLLLLGGAIAKQRRTSNICCFCLLFYMNRNFPVPSDMEKFQFCYCAKKKFPITKNYVLQHLIKNLSIPRSPSCPAMSPLPLPLPTLGPTYSRPFWWRRAAAGRRRRDSPAATDAEAYSAAAAAAAAHRPPRSGAARSSGRTCFAVRE